MAQSTIKKMCALTISGYVWRVVSLDVPTVAHCLGSIDEVFGVVVPRFVPNLDGRVVPDDHYQDVMFFVRTRTNPNGVVECNYLFTRTMEIGDGKEKQIGNEEQDTVE